MFLIFPLYGQSCSINIDYKLYIYFILTMLKSNKKEKVIQKKKQGGFLQKGTAAAWRLGEEALARG